MTEREIPPSPNQRVCHEKIKRNTGSYNVASLSEVSYLYRGAEDCDSLTDFQGAVLVDPACQRDLRVPGQP